MAKQWTVTVSVNGGTAANHTVLTQNSETDISATAFQWRIWETLALTWGDYYVVTGISGPTNATDPVGGWSAIGGSLFLSVLQSGQISLAFIES